ncbi:MAG: hypothetical protein LUE99_16425 [Bacteroides sp.]|nr:hypothetical protein [Bacteroides sp.]
MKQFTILCLFLLGWSGINVQAQDEGLPQNYSIILGGGVSLPHVEGNRNDFFSKNGDRAGYDIMLEGRYYFLPQFALGVQYDYLRIARLPDKIHLHYIRPNITFRHLWSNGNQGAFLSFGIGYMDYQERTYKRGERSGHLFQRGYCGISFGTGYEFRIARQFSGILRMDMLTADWFANPDARLYNTDGYDDGVNHNWFKNNITFFNLGFAVQFGR